MAPKGAQALILRTCDSITLHGMGTLQMSLRLRTTRWKIILGCPGGLSLITSIHKQRIFPVWSERGMGKGFDQPLQTLQLEKRSHEPRRMGSL